MDSANLILCILSCIVLTLITRPITTDSDTYDENILCTHDVASFIEVEPVYTSKLDIKNDQYIINNSDLVCKPDSFGYTSEEADRLFPNVKFPKCKNRSDANSSMHIENDVLHINCAGKYKGKYVLGVNYQQEEFGYFEFTNEPVEYTYPVFIGDVEYVMATCDPDKTKDFEQILYRNRPNRSSLQRASDSLKTEPINIAMVVLDSVSRRSFYRKLPETVSYLNSQNSDGRVYDFLLHNVMGEYSSDSFMPTFFGDMPFKRLEGDLQGDVFYEQSIWKTLHSRVKFILGVCDHDGY